ncbi:tetratricopeptide repeat protein, partial [Actinoplanes sp. NPDC026670]|uniref:tetratricopeptide repeat protein n=1 Tax=Actinoplanes sp. NPDC026670 TaxID=3154700 RepID=UPI0033C97372
MGLALHGHALAAAVASGDEAGIASVLNSLGFINGRLGRHDEAAEQLLRARESFQRVGDRIGEGRTLGNLGTVESARGRLQRSADYQTQALEVFLSVGDALGRVSHCSEPLVDDGNDDGGFEPDGELVVTGG